MTELDEKNSTETEKNYKILFNFHHSITDGFSSCRIIGHFMNALNDVLMDEQIDDSKQLALLANFELEMTEKFTEIFSIFENNPIEKECLTKSIENLKCVVLTLKLIPQNDTTVQPTTFNIRHNFTVEQTRELLSLCTEKGVTFHAMFSTIAHTALFKILKDAGLKESKMKMVSRHSVNMRRYFKTDSGSLEKFGPGFLLFETATTLHPKLDFWDQCLAYHNEFHSSLKNEIPLKQAVIRFSQGSGSDNTDWEDTSPKHYYDTTNMGECTQILTGNFARRDHLPEHLKKVVLTDFCRTTSNHTMGVSCSHVLQTFKGRLLYSLDYNINHMAAKTAQKYVAKIVQVAENLVL